MNVLVLWQLFVCTMGFPTVRVSSFAIRLFLVWEKVFPSNFFLLKPLHLFLLRFKIAVDIHKRCIPKLHVDPSLLVRFVRLAIFPPSGKYGIFVENFLSLWWVNCCVQAKGFGRALPNCSFPVDFCLFFERLDPPWRSFFPKPWTRMGAKGFSCVNLFPSFEDVLLSKFTQTIHHPRCPFYLQR